jgi:AraC family transcriptional regulator
MHDVHDGRVELDAIAAAACLSKFHFLRLFKSIHHVSPYQYLQELRIQKAEQLLKRSNVSIVDIAQQLGFENSNSFSRLFLQHKGVYPSQYRLSVN